MSEDYMPPKRELSYLRFSVWDTEDEENDEPIFNGNYVDIVEYLKENGTDGLEVSAVDTTNWDQMYPMKAKKFMEWYNHWVLPEIVDNEYDDDIMTYFPTAHTNLNEEDV